jgi:hypothetical protein
MDNFEPSSSTQHWKKGGTAAPNVGPGLTGWEGQVSHTEARSVWLHRCKRGLAGDHSVKDEVRREGEEWRGKLTSFYATWMGTQLLKGQHTWDPSAHSENKFPRVHLQNFVTREQPWNHRGRPCPLPALVPKALWLLESRLTDPTARLLSAHR